MRYLLVLAFTIFLACTTADNGDIGETPPAGGDTGPIQTEEVSYTDGETNMKGFLAFDKTKTEKRPAVLIVHEWWGHNDYTRKRAIQLAEMGYTALAIDMFGDGKQAAHPQDAMKFSGEVFQNLTAGEARFRAAMDLVKKHDSVNPEKVAAIGYCFGGGIVLHMARIGTDLDAVVSFHGSLDSHHEVAPGSIKAQIMVCNGQDDPFVTEEQIAAFKKEMDNAGAVYEFINYQGAVHAFTNPDADANGEKFSLPLAYDAHADTSSWNHMSILFNVLLRPESMN